MNLLSSVGSAIASAFQSCISVCRKRETLDLPQHHLKIISQIAEGATGIVYIVEDDKKKRHALKKIIAQSQEMRNLAVWETKVYQEMNHHNLIRLEDASNQPDPTKPDTTYFYLLFPFCSRGSLEDEFRRRKFSEAEALLIFHGICKGLQQFHTHDPPYAHRDLKPGNVLLRESETKDGPEFVPVLTDFGSTSVARVHIQSRRQANQLQEWAATHCTMHYRPPELFDVPSNCLLDERSDIWSLGCVLYALAFGKSPFDADITKGGSVALAVMSGKYEIPNFSKFSKGYCALIAAMLQPKISDRPYIGAVINRVEGMLREIGVAIPRSQPPPATPQPEPDYDQDLDDEDDHVALNVRDGI